MTNLKAFGQFSPFSVGFDEIFNTLHRASIPQSNYPPYDILKEAISDTDDKYIIRIAIAGFKKSEVDIEIDDNTLTVSVCREDKTGKQRAEFLHKGISTKEFYKSFALAEHVEVKKATMSDGILRIMLEKNIPDSEKPKKIKISG
jgi:molecular chaperone IbpA